MTTDTLWLVLDIGTSGVKAALMTDDGEVVHSIVQPYPTYSDGAGVAEQDADDWWQAVIAACRGFDADLSRVTAIALTGQMQDLILITEDSEPLRRVILYSDTRAQKEAEDIARNISRERLRALTGNDQGADSLLAKCVWLQRHQPKLLERARYLLFGSADYIGFKLTGTAAVDTTTASSTGFMHLSEFHWLDEELFHRIEIEAVIPLLPLLVIGGAMIGKLTDEAAATLGLTAGISVYHGPGDAGATTLGVGSGEIGQAYGYLGTSGWVAFTDTRQGSPDQGIITLSHPRLEQYIQVAPLLTAGGNLEWVRELFLVDDRDFLIAQALDRPVTDLLYLPYLSGERAPFSDPLARAAFIGINRSTDPGDLCRAVLEGVVFAYRHALDALLTSRPEALIMTGGGTRSEAWVQLFADVLGTQITIPADAENVAGRGAIIAALVARGSQEDYSPRGYSPIKATLQPNPADYERYEQKYNLYRAAYPALKSIFADLAETRK